SGRHRALHSFPTRRSSDLGTFYSLQRAALFRQWYVETPDGFRFAVKGGRFITHMKRLVDVELPLANFFASGVLCLEEKLGPFLRSEEHTSELQSRENLVCR